MARRCVDGGFGLDGCPRSPVAVFRDPTYWLEGIEKDAQVHHGFTASIVAESLTPLVVRPATKPRKPLPAPVPQVGIVTKEAAYVARS